MSSMFIQLAMKARNKKNNKKEEGTHGKQCFRNPSSLFSHKKTSLTIFQSFSHTKTIA